LRCIALHFAVAMHLTLIDGHIQTSFIPSSCRRPIAMLGTKKLSNPSFRGNPFSFARSSHYGICRDIRNSGERKVMARGVETIYALSSSEAPLRSATTSATAPLTSSTSLATEPPSATEAVAFVSPWPLTCYAGVTVGDAAASSSASRRSSSFLAFAMLRSVWVSWSDFQKSSFALTFSRMGCRRHSWEDRLKKKRSLPEQKEGSCICLLQGETTLQNLLQVWPSVPFCLSSPPYP